MPDRDAVQRSPFLGRTPELAAAAGSLALSALALAPPPLPNNDGVLYIVAAEAFRRSGLEAAAALHPWPFYPAFVASLSTLSGLSIETAAHLAGALLLALSSLLIVALARQVGGDERVAWCAALVAVCHPWLNRARSLIIRDDGAWAFGLLALLFLLRSECGRRWSALAGWVICGVLAVLCRPDSVILMAAGPVAVALASHLHPRSRKVRALVLCLPAVLAGAAAVAWLVADPGPYQDLFTLEALTKASGALAAAFPLPYGREYAPFILVSGLLLIPFVKTLKATGLVHLGLAAAGAGAVARIDRFSRAALFASLLATVAPLYVQIFRLLFVESRYTVYASLLVSVVAPFGLEPLLRRDTSGPGRVTGFVLVLALGVTAFLNFPRRMPSEGQIRAAADWIRKEAPGARLHTSNLQLAYRSGAPVNWNAIQHAQLNALPGVVVATAGELWGISRPAALAAPPHDFQLAASFPGPDGNVLAVYRCGAPVCRATRP